MVNINMLKDQLLSSFSKSFNFEPLSILMEMEPTTMIYIHATMEKAPWS